MTTTDDRFREVFHRIKRKKKTIKNNIMNIL